MGNDVRYSVTRAAVVMAEAAAVRLISGINIGYGFDTAAADTARTSNITPTIEPKA